MAALVCCFSVCSAAIFEQWKPTGLHFKHENSPSSRKHLIVSMGGGVALLDYNNDGLLDIFLVNSGRIREPMAGVPDFGRSDPKYWNRLYRQNKDHSFTDVTEQAGLSNAGDANYGMGVAAADYDNDGYTDLYVTNYGKNTLYRNNGNGTFSDVTLKSGVGARGWSASAGFVDFDNDGNLDLFVTRYMQWDFAHSKVCSRDTYCPPGEFPMTTNILYKNRGDGTFEDISRSSGIAGSPGRSLGVAFGDYDGDGRPDIFVANDGMGQFLFHNDGAGKFSERSLNSGVSLSDDGKTFSGMGVDFRDYDNDGRPDLIITNLARQVYAAYHNDGKGLFSYASQATGLSALSAGSSGWGVRWEDFDNDGWKDLFVAQSHVMDNIETLDAALHYQEPPLLAMNHHGRFDKGDVGENAVLTGRGAAFGDLNNDGAIDVVMTVLGSEPVLLRNTHADRNHWLTLQLKGTKSNRDGFGATVNVNGQTQYCNSAGSYLSASDKRVHFGLSDQTSATVEIKWPSGINQHLSGVRADQFLLVAEPAE